MTKNIVAKIDLILHATEDFQKIVESLDDLFGIESDEIAKREVTGHFGHKDDGVIHVLELCLV